MQAVQHQGTLRQGGALVAQHRAGNCTQAMRAVKPSLLASSTAVDQHRASRPVSVEQSSSSSPAPSSHTLQTGTHWSLPL